MQLIRDRYELLETLGTGGQGRVVRALDRQLQRHVALKIRTVHDDEAREELLGEARILLAIPPHPGLPLVREDFFEGDSYVVAMDWVDGTDLDTLLRDRGRPGLAPSSVLAYLADAAAALTHLHSLDPPIIHGDVKPANLVLARGGRVKLVDFGVSSAPDELRRRSGTPGYRAPELAGAGTPSRASDVYSLAATAFALLTGGPPAGVLPPWQGIDPAQQRQLEDVIRAGLATEPGRRPATPGELVERLRTGWGDALPTGVMTFVLSDIVGSTEKWESDPAAMAGALVRHDELIAEAVESHGGRFLKSMGEADSTVSVFDSAQGALEAALAASRRIAEEPWPGGLELAVRLGLHTGEAQRRGADYFGATVNLAGRVRDEADAGQVLLSSATAALVVPPKGCSLVDIGRHRLRGVGTPQRLLAVGGPGLSAPLPAAECPYRGLLAFEPDHRTYFFGREAVIEDVLARLEPRWLLAVVGASGSGKSSVLRAGVVAAVQAGEVDTLDRATIITPGAAPHLDVRDDPRHLVVVDQFEELYTLCDDRGRRDRFIDGLLALSSPVLIALRADLYGQLTGHPALARAVADNQILLGAMSDAELERAVTEPARLAGLRLEPGLVELVLRDVAGEPGALPLLSHALRVTWEHRDGRTLTVEGYRESGGVASAIAQTADEVVASVPAEGRPLLRSLFVRLTELGDGTEDSRRRVGIDELVPEGSSRGEVEALLQRLAEARLVTLGEGTAEVAHEVLIREWPTLRGWLEEDRAGVLLHRDLGHAARQWETGGRETGDLYRSTRLGAAVDWAARNPDALNATERAFLDASVEDAKRAAERQRRANRRLRALLAGAAVLLVLAVAAGLLAGSQRATAQDALRTEAAQRLGAEAITVDRVDRALRLAVAGNVLDDSRATRSNLLRVLLRDPGALRVFGGDGDRSLDVATSADDSLIAIGDVNGTVTVHEIATGRRVGAYDTGVEITGLEFAPGSDRLAVTGLARVGVAAAPARLLLIDARSLRLHRSVALPHPERSVDYKLQVAYAPDGRSLAVVYVPRAADAEPARIGHLDAETGARRGPLRPLGEELGAFSGFFGTRSGDFVYVARETQVIDGATLRVRRRFPARGTHAAISADGTTVALGDQAGRVGLVDLRSGRARTLPGRDAEAVESLAFSPDGRKLAVDGHGGRVVVWDLELRRVVETLEGHTGVIVDQRFSADGRTLYTLSDEGHAIAWDISGARRLAAWFDTGVVGLRRDFPPAFAVSPDGRELAVARLDGKVDLIDAETLRRRLTFAAFARGMPAAGIAYAPDGQRVAVAGALGRVGVWDARSGTRIGPYVRAVEGCERAGQAERDPRCIGELIQALAFVEGGRLATATIGGAIEIWDLDRRRAVRPAHRLASYVVALDASPDGRRIAASFGYLNSENGVEVIDVRSGRQLARLAGGGEPRAVAFSDDGRRLVTGSTNGSALIWDTASWRRIGGPLAHRGLLVAARFSPDGKRLATSSAEGTVALWDLASRQVIGAPLPRVPDRRRPAAGRTDRWVTVHFSGEGSRLFAVYDNGRGVRWEVDPQAWRRHACQVAGGGLTRREWEATAPEQGYRPTC